MKRTLHRLWGCDWEYNVFPPRCFIDGCCAVCGRHPDEAPFPTAAECVKIVFFVTVAAGLLVFGRLV